MIEIKLTLIYKKVVTEEVFEELKQALYDKDLQYVGETIDLEFYDAYVLETKDAN